MTTPSFTDLVGCARPLQLAGMGGVSTPELAAAVSNAGGLGMIGASGVPVDMLGGVLEILQATSKPFGVNFLMPFLDPEALALAAGKARVVEFFFGDPDSSLVEIAHTGGALVSWMAESSIGSYPLQVVAGSHSPSNRGPAERDLLVLSLELTIDGSPWLGAAPAIVGNMSVTPPPGP